MGMRHGIPVMLIILDGWGVGDKSPNNAVYTADTPNMDAWMKRHPCTTLDAHNGAVGLPPGQMGNSEVGHLNIGAGRIVYQDLTRINKAIADGEFFTNKTLATALDHTKKRGAALHLLGLLSDGGVHSHMEHLRALVEMAAARGLEKIYIHAFMDGRDTPPKSGAGYMRDLLNALRRIGRGEVATIAGRYWAMDRDNRWTRVQKAWQALVEGKGVKPATADALQAVNDAYGRGETDEFIKPIVMPGAGGGEKQEPLATINDGDTVIFFNFRPDRARELTRAFTAPSFTEFAAVKRPALGEFVTFTRYEKHFDLPVAFPPAALHRILGEEFSRHNLRQLRIAETEKYAHVTYFFNGGREAPFPLEERVLIPSPKDVATYDLKPEMSAFEITAKLLELLQNNQYSLVVLNFANGDMVGHSGITAATVQACAAVDRCLGPLVERFTGQGGAVLITADHGNAEIMRDPETKEPFTAHSANPVPLILISDKYPDCRLRRDGALRDIAPTILRLADLPQPAEMDGTSLIVEE